MAENTSSTKHQPATPLPWRAINWTSHAKSTVLIDDAAETRGKRIVADCEAYEPAHRETDAAYIVHAANAYPKLVEALRGASVLPFHGSDNGERWDEGYKAGFSRALNDVHALAAALLSDLGEAETSALFMIGGSVAIYTLADMLKSNADDHETCEWLRSAPIHAQLPCGGGAAPVQIITRVQ